MLRGRGITYRQLAFSGSLVPSRSLKQPALRSDLFEYLLVLSSYDSGTELLWYLTVPG